MNAHAVLITEAENIMFNGGFAEVRIEHFGPWWRVYGKLPDANEHVGTTHLQGDPQDPREMARKLVAIVSARAAKPEVSPEPAPSDGYESAEAVETETPTFAPEDDPFGPVEQTDAANDPDAAVWPTTDPGEAEAVDEPAGGGASEPGPGEAGVSDLALYEGAGGNEAIDADFTDGEPVGGLEGEDLNLPELEPPPLADEGPEEDRAAGGVAYFGDNIDVIRMAKLGRLGQIARALKATLQEGWTLEEFRTLQNKIVRIDQGLDPDDPEGRARFHAINERSAAMGRVDAYKAMREGELEALGREQRAEIEAFDTEAGWP